jgi:adenylate cyclase
VRKWEDQVRVAVQLVNAENGFPLWSGCYDRKVHDILAVQEELARSIASALESAIAGAGGAACPPQAATLP